jgi:hypothetical protein
LQLASALYRVRARKRHLKRWFCVNNGYRWFILRR